MPSVSVGSATAGTRTDNSVVDGSVDERLKSTRIASYFGKVRTKPHMRQIFSGFSLTQQEAEKYISETIVSCLKGETDLINMLLVDNAIRQYSSTSENIYSLIELIYQTVSEYMKKISDSVQTKIAEKQFTVEFFTKMKNTYFNSFTKLTQIFSTVNDLFNVDGTTIFKIMRDYVFYEQVLNRKYELSGKQLHMFAVLISVVDKTNREQITNVFKTVNTYNGFSYSLTDKKKRNEIFNEELDLEGGQPILDKFLTEEFVKQIDQKIRRLFEQISDTQRSQLVDDITDSVRMCQKISNPIIFMMLYYQYLQKRLLTLSYTDRDTALNTEQVIIKLLNPKDAPEIHMACMFAINDVRSIDLINTEFRNVPIKFESDRYPKSFQESFDRYKTEFVVLRKNVWTTLNDRKTSVDRIEEPTIIKSYMNMFNDFYDKFFKTAINKLAPSGYDCRRISYDYFNSFADLKLEIGDKVYKLHATLIQACMLMHIMEAGGSTVAEELSIKMNMKLKDINNEINSLLMSKVIVRDVSNDSGDVRVGLSLNDEFHSDTTNIDLVEYLAKAEEAFRAYIAKKENEERLAKEAERNRCITLAKTVVMRALVESPDMQMSIEKIKDVAKTDATLRTQNVDVDDDLVNSVLESMMIAHVVRKVEPVPENQTGATVYELIPDDEQDDDNCDDQEDLENKVGVVIEDIMKEMNLNTPRNDQEEVEDAEETDEEDDDDEVVEADPDVEAENDDDIEDPEEPNSVDNNKEQDSETETDEIDMNKLIEVEEVDSKGISDAEYDESIESEDEVFSDITDEDMDIENEDNGEEDAEQSEQFSDVDSSDEDEEIPKQKIIRSVKDNKPVAQLAETTNIVKVTQKTPTATVSNKHPTGKLSTSEESGSKKPTTRVIEKEELDESDTGSDVELKQVSDSPKLKTDGPKQSGTKIKVNITELENRMNALQKTIQTKKQALKNQRNADKRRALRDEITKAEKGIADLEDEIDMYLLGNETRDDQNDSNDDMDEESIDQTPVVKKNTNTNTGTVKRVVTRVIEQAIADLDDEINTYPKSATKTTQHESTDASESSELIEEPDDDTDDGVDEDKSTPRTIEKAIAKAPAKVTTKVTTKAPVKAQTKITPKPALISPTPQSTKTSNRGKQGTDRKMLSTGGRPLKIKQVEPETESDDDEGENISNDTSDDQSEDVPSDNADESDESDSSDDGMSRSKTIQGRGRGRGRGRGSAERVVQPKTVKIPTEPVNGSTIRGRGSRTGARGRGNRR